MVLKISESLINDVPTSLKMFLAKNLGLTMQAKLFREKPVQTVDSKYSLYVGQGEYAFIPSADKSIKIIGSDEATTCHVLVLKDNTSSVAVGHFDGSFNEEKMMKNILKNFEKRSENLPIDAYVIGGYNEDEITPSNRLTKENVSESISLKLLKMLIEAKIDVNMQLWCTCELNTKIRNGKYSPLFYGLAYDRECNSVFPAYFPDQVPNFNLRSASHWVMPKSYKNIYNFNNKCVSILPFSNYRNEYFASISMYNDYNILKRFSSSPEVEPPNFCNRLRSVFSLLGQSSTESLFPNGLPINYIMNSDGIWVKQ